MIVIPNNGVTTTQRPLLKIRLSEPLPIGSDLQVFQGSSLLGSATLAENQQNEPGQHYEFRHEGAGDGTYSYTATVVSNGASIASTAYNVTVALPVNPAIKGVYEQEEKQSGIFLYCPNIQGSTNSSNYYIEARDFGIIIAIMPEEPSGIYYVTCDADADAWITNLGIGIEHVTGTITTYDRLASENFDWWDKYNNSGSNITGSTLTLHWPNEERTASAIVPLCGLPED